MKFFYVNDIYLYHLKIFLEACFLWHNFYISTDRLNEQKQPFADVLQNMYSEKFRNNQRKAPMLESLFNKVALLLNKVKTNLKSTWFILLPGWLYRVNKSIKGALNKFLTSMKKPVFKYYLHINGYLHCTNPSLFFKFHVKWLIPLALVRLF